MDTRYNVVRWLESHRGYDMNDAPDEDYEHFVEILTDVADYCIDEKIKQLRSILDSLMIDTRDKANIIQMIKE